MPIDYSLAKPVAGTSRGTSPTEVEILTDVSDTVADIDSRITTLDGAAVKLTGSQTVAGVKTFTDLFRISKTFTDVPVGLTRLALATVTARGTQTTQDRRTAVGGAVIDEAGVVGDKTISNAANNGSGLIRLTATAHGITNGDAVAVWDVAGTTEANNKWVATVVDADTIDLQGSTFTNAYVSGGKITNRPMMNAVSAVVTPSVPRGGITGAAVNGDDLNGFVAYNNGTTKATESFYCGDNPGITGYQWFIQFTANSESEVGFAVGNTGDVDKAFALGGTIKASGYGLDLYSAAGSPSTWGAGAQAIRLPNAKAIVGRNAAGAADVALLNLNASNVIEIGGASALLVDTSNGHLAFGTTPLTMPLLIKSDSNTAFRATRDSNAITFEMDAYATSGSPSFLGRRAMGTEASKSQVTNNEDLARFGGAGYHSGNAFSVARGYMAVRATESWTSTAQGSKIVFLTTATGGTTTALRWTIDNDGALTAAEGVNVAAGTTTGTKFGTATNQKLAFYNATPIVQPSGVTSKAALEALGLGASLTDDATYMVSGFPSTHHKPAAGGGTGFPAANSAVYERMIGRGSISRIAINVSVASGNISVAAYTNSGSGRAAQPTGGRLATSGATACPAAGYAEVSLGATITVENGDWFAISCDNTTASIHRAAGAGAANDIGLGWLYGQTTAHPLPVTPASLVARSGPDYVMVGENA